MSKVKSKDFKSIKQLADLNLTNKQIFNITGFSVATVSRVRKQDTWADYVKFKKEYNTNRKHQIAMKNAGEKTYEWQTTDLRADNNTLEDTIADLTDMQRLVMAVNRIADTLEKIDDNTRPLHVIAPKPEDW